MRILAISDVHGNLPALEAVLAEAGEVDMVLCAGDVAGYFPYVDEVVRTLSGLRQCRCVMGNHDAVLLDARRTTNSFTADLALRMQRGTVRPKTKAFIAALPTSLRLEVDGRTVRLFHGTPDDPLNGRERYWERGELEPGLYVSGHTHLRQHFETASRDAIVFNPGGTGFPRDGTTEAPFAIVDTQGWRITFHRAAYDIARLVARCGEVGLPPHLARSIERGRWVHYNERTGES